MSPAPPPSALLDLQDRSALVTGGGGGIGSAVAELLLRAGARVANVDLPGRPGPAGVVDLPLDLSDAEAIGALGAKIDETLGGLDVLVHAAGITRDGVLWKMTPDMWRQVLAVNLDAAFHLLQVAVPRMRAQKRGSVVLVSSINGERGKFGQTNYAASKAGLLGLARAAAKETGRFGVRVNVVAPGMILTPMTRDLPGDIQEAAKAETALGRLGTPEDVARAVLYLASDLSTHVTGQVLRVDGGQLMA